MGLKPAGHQKYLQDALYLTFADAKACMHAVIQGNVAAAAFCCLQ